MTKSIDEIIANKRLDAKKKKNHEANGNDKKNGNE